MRPCCPSFWLSICTIALACIIGGCEGESSKAGAVCGEGTREQEGACVAIETDTLSCGPGTAQQGSMCIPTGCEDVDIITCGAGTSLDESVCVAVSNIPEPTFCIPEAIGAPTPIMLDSSTLGVWPEGGLVFADDHYVAVYGLGSTTVVARAISTAGVLGTRYTHTGQKSVNGAVYNNGHVAVLIDTFSGSPKLLILDAQGGFVATANLTGSPRTTIAYLDGFGVLYDKELVPVSSAGVVAGPQTLLGSAINLTVANNPVAGTAMYSGYKSDCGANEPVNLVNATSWAPLQTDPLPSSVNGDCLQWAPLVRYERGRFGVLSSLASIGTMDMVFRTYDAEGQLINPGSTFAMGQAVLMDFTVADNFIAAYVSSGVSNLRYYLLDRKGTMYKPGLLPATFRIAADAASQAMAADSNNGLGVLYKLAGSPPASSPVMFTLLRCPAS